MKPYTAKAEIDLSQFDADDFLNGSTVEGKVEVDLSQFDDDDLLEAADYDPDLYDQKAHLSDFDDEDVLRYVKSNLNFPVPNMTTLTDQMKFELLMKVYEKYDLPALNRLFPKL